MDPRTKKEIESLLPNARPWAEAHIAAIVASGLLPKNWVVKIISGTRTYAAQNELYAQGRTKPGQIVTNARGGQSNHNFGIAWDLGLFDSFGKYLEEHDLYTNLGPIGEDLGLEWGGRWQFIDLPHYQIKTGLNLAGLRAAVANKQEIPVPIYGKTLTVPNPNSKPEFEIWDGSEKTDIPAFMAAGRVWVAARPFVNRFGGRINEVNGNNFVIDFGSAAVAMSGTISGGVGFVKFADINRILDWEFDYKPNRLTIQTPEAL